MTRYIRVTIEHAQQIAGHTTPKTTKLSHRRGGCAIAFDEIEWIGI